MAKRASKIPEEYLGLSLALQEKKSTKEYKKIASELNNSMEVCSPTMDRIIEGTQLPTLKVAVILARKFDLSLDRIFGIGEKQ